MARVFCSYSHKDERLRQQLRAHLSVLVRDGAITFWSDRAIMAGGVFEQEISSNLESAEIVLLLVSADFLASSYCYDVELQRALQLHELGRTRVVPVILRDCDWQHTPFGKLKALPEDGRPVKSWPDRDKAFKNIVDELRTLIGAGANPQPHDESDTAWASDPQGTPLPTLDMDRLRQSHSSGNSPSPPKSGRPQLERFLPKLADLIDVADHLQHLTSDIRFARGGGTINYYFDTNVFQLFLKPQRFFSSVSLFHSPKWGRANDEAAWRRVNVQSALLTGEFLFSGSLPGQEGSLVYMTEWHRWELLQQARHLISEARGTAPRSDVTRDFLYRLASFRAAITANDGASPDTDMPDRRMISDLQLLREAGVPEEQLDTYLTTRLALEAVAEEDQITTICQLKRMLAPEFFRSIRGPDDLDDIDVVDLSDDAHQWYVRLVDEARRHPLHDRRPPSSLSDDARSLALLIRLAERSAAKGERTVLVTYDTLVYAAYQRWHDETSWQEPFVLRRVSQYAPIFTLGDRDIIESPSAPVIDEYVEMALLPFNIVRESKPEGRFRPLRRTFARQIADERLTGASFLSGAMGHVFADANSEWYGRVVQEVESLAQAWRQVETLTLGLNPDLLAYRISLMIPSTLSFPSDASELSHHEVEEWLRTALESLHRKAIELWLPIAHDTIWRHRQVASTRRDNYATSCRQIFSFSLATDPERPPQLVEVGWPAHPDGEDSLGLPLRGEGGETYLLGHPIVAFAVSAVLCAEQMQFPEAARFAQLCVEGASAEEGEAGVVASNAAEAQRLAAWIATLRSDGGAMD